MFSKLWTIYLSIVQSEYLTFWSLFWWPLSAETMSWVTQESERVKSENPEAKYSRSSKFNPVKPDLILFHLFCSLEALQLQSVQVNFSQKLLFLHQLTHNMTTDCSLFMKIVGSEYLQNMLCTQIVAFVLFWQSEQFWYTSCSADVASFWKRFTCKTHNSGEPNFRCGFATFFLFFLTVFCTKRWFQNTEFCNGEQKVSDFSSIFLLNCWSMCQVPIDFGAIF